MATNKNENYLRLHLLNSEAVGVLKATFLKVTKNKCNGDRDQFLKEFEDEIKQLSFSQRKLLFPENGRTDVDDWDVSLLSFVLINCCSLEGKICISKLRDLMKKQMSAFTDITAFLAYHKCRIDQMKAEGVIDDIQYNKLYPKQSSTLNDWDLHLLLSMLVVFCSGQNKEKLYELLRKCVARDVQLHCPNLNLANYLNQKKSECKSMLKNGYILQKEYNQLFPKHGAISDFNKWDNHLIEVFVTNICVGIGNNTMKAVSNVRKIRNEMLAHKGTAEMETDQFLKTWTDLKKAIEIIIQQEVPDIKQEWTKKHEELQTGPFDVTGTIRVLNEYYCKENSKYESIIDILNAIENKIELANKQREAEYKSNQLEIGKLNKMNESIAVIADKVKYLVDQHDQDKARDIYTEPIVAECIHIKIEVASANDDSRIRTENAILSAIKNLLQGGNPAEIKIKTEIKTVSKLFDGITRDGTEVVDVQSGSVILKVKCISLKGITNLLVQTESQELRKELEDELKNEIDEDISLGCGITDESKETIINDLDRIRTEHESKKQLVVKYIESDPFIQEAEEMSYTNSELETSNDTPSQSIQTESSSSIPPKVPQAEKIQTFDIQCPEDLHFCEISSCTVIPTGHILVCDYKNNNVKLFDKHYTYRSVLDLPGGPYNSCLSGEDNTEVLVTVPDTKSIFRIKVTDDMRLKDEIVVGDKCWGITSCIAGIAVSSILSNTGNSCIQLLQYDGTLIKRLDIPLGKSRITSIMKGRQLVIADSESSRLTSLDVEMGDTVFVYEDYDLEYPQSVTSDSQDNVYVIGVFYFNVHAITGKGVKLGNVLTSKDGLNSPHSLEYNRYNDTIIIQPQFGKNEMCVYKIVK